MTTYNINIHDHLQYQHPRPLTISTSMTTYNINIHDHLQYQHLNNTNFNEANHYFLMSNIHDARLYYCILHNNYILNSINIVIVIYYGINVCTHFSVASFAH